MNKEDIIGLTLGYLGMLVGTAYLFFMQSKGLSP
jgi:hypothetical protein